MNNLNIYLLFFSIFICTFSFAQNEKVFKISNNLYEKPMLLNKNDKVLISIDEAYLINKKRFMLYEEAKKSVLNMNFGVANTMIKEYENSLRNSEKAYKSLYEQYQKANENCEKTINLTQKTLKNQSQFLEDTKASLKLVQQELDATNEILKKEQKKGFKSKLIWGASGTVLGMVLAIIFF